ncbi:phospholipase A2-like isoform X2 [Peromyscus maniculatus bairdii]|uniref:phospholipase A2-like isoform X1 n=1 Tax=Peromyscus maniculatus bairdii TaxID=230844 RepID=UPI003FD51A3D
MKLLLLVTLLTGATAQSIGPQAEWHLGNMFECNIPTNGAVLEEKFYGCFCSLWGPGYDNEKIERCCRTREDCLFQVNNLENCAVLIRNPYTSSYLFSCPGSEITCSDKNNPCQAYICNCDREAAICLFEQKMRMFC